MLYVSIDHLPSHSVSYRPCKLAKQSARTLTLYYPHYLSYRARWRKRYQYVYMLFHHFHLYYLKSIILTYPPYQLLRSFLNLLPLKYPLAIFRTPDKMITRIINRMTRPLDRHALYIPYPRARAYLDKGDFSSPPYQPPRKGMHSSPRQAAGDSAKYLLKRSMVFLSAAISGLMSFKAILALISLSRTL